jgi:methyl-accepting chemotaxis protein
VHIVSRPKKNGMVTIEEETWIYAIKPLSSMYTQSFTPCLLTSTRPIEARLNSVKMVISGLASAALIGAIILSLVLTSSLIGPISRIDIAAQQVGNGNLNVTLPKHGK